jgi:tetratricopeptide (TPR) repeat protein/tRNA A-37 threonylcarbamoyl transferase component Bud32
MSDKRLDSLLLAWQEQRLQGRDVPAAELCRDCPELAAELSQRIQLLRRMRFLMQTSDAPAGPAAPQAARDPVTGNQQTSFASDGTPETLDQAGATRSLSSPLPEAVPGYEILGELGRGGMGVVYKARQQTLNRTVALKMVLAGCHASPEALVRFLQEAETIARLKHPNVVQVHEFGNHQGKPYFALEYLEGGSLAARLHRQPQPPLQAARLVETLARAVQAAHEQGVIHRDLKPANVLLTADGTPKVTDFGLAKHADSGITASGAVLGTPSYMAPEQAQGKVREVGPAADVYALGAILYELLTGRPPFQGATAWDTLQLVTGTEPVAPSRLQPKLPRDLETVCLKCLHKEPAGRYASAFALAEDLKRFLNDEPIVARPAGWAERLRRWGRRNPVVAGLSAALLLVLVGTLVGVTLLWQNAEDQRDEAVAAQQRAQRLAVEARRQQRIAEAQSRLAGTEAARARREATKAQRTAQVLTQMFEATDPLGLSGIPALKPRAGEVLTARQILDRGAARVVRDLGAEPETQATLMDTLGRVYCTLGLTAQARPLLTESLALRRRLPKDHPDLAVSLHNLAWLRHQTGDYPTAKRLYQEALAIRQKHAQANPIALSATLLNLGWLLTDLEDFGAAEKMFQEAIALRLRRLGPDHREVAVARVGLVALYITQGKVTEALPHYQQARATLRKVEGGKGLAESIDLFQRGVMARYLPPFARRLLLGLKDDQAVEDCLKRALDLAREALGDHHAYVALVLHELAFTLGQHHKEEAAEHYYEDCLRIAREYGLDHPKATILLGNYCFLLQRRGKQVKAELLLEEALQVRRERSPVNHSSIADVLVIQAALLADASASSRRQQLLREALTIYCKSPGAPRGYFPFAVRLLAASLTAPENYAVACQLARVAAARSEQGRERDRYLDLAMIALRRAREKGFKDVERLRQDKNLDGLREREEFQKLLAEWPGRSGR